LALGAQKLLPVMQQIYHACSTIQGNYSSLQSTLTFLDQKMPRDHSNLNSLQLKFHKSIQLSGLQFRYTSQNHDVIKNLNLTIKKGDRIGIIGETGSGKSTLIDILMGLLEPTKGSLKIDGKKITALNVRSWQKHIAHVPQFIFLSDTTIAENIAFSVDKKAINYELVHDAANRAKLHKVINQFPNKYNTKIGERGIKLSGGQRQRIGIARALYKHADVFIFDEATSSLDNKTEDLVMNSLDDLGSEITIIMIAHRLTTLKKCNKIIEIADGKIVNVGSYRDIIKSSH
jgi:ATP-binding cassette subfamily B protein